MTTNFEVKQNEYQKGYDHGKLDLSDRLIAIYEAVGATSELDRLKLALQIARWK